MNRPILLQAQTYKDTSEAIAAYAQIIDQALASLRKPLSELHLRLVRTWISKLESY